VGIYRSPELNAFATGPTKSRALVAVSTGLLSRMRENEVEGVLGHEISGEISEAGKDAGRYKAGERVFVAHHVPCNTCRYCLNGQHTVCETLHTTNFYPGGFSEYIRVPAINVDRGVFTLPEEISYEEGTFIEPLACVLRGQRTAQLQPGRSILILGGGISGMLHVLAARASGAGRIVVTDINEYRLKAAKALGADAVINARENVPVRLREANGNRLADLVIVCTGAMPAFMQALQCIDRAGTLLCFAPTEPGVTLPVPVNDFWRQGIKIVHSYGSSPFDTMIAIDMLRQGVVPVGKLVTHRLAMKDAGLGFKLVAEAGECIKVILEPHRTQ
jgi:L-iditol 2-dehydrogenase